MLWPPQFSPGTHRVDCWVAPRPPGWHKDICIYIYTLLGTNIHIPCQVIFENVFQYVSWRVARKRCSEKYFPSIRNPKLCHSHRSFKSTAPKAHLADTVQTLYFTPAMLEDHLLFMLVHSVNCKMPHVLYSMDLGHVFFIFFVECSLPCKFIGA